MTGDSGHYFSAGADDIRQAFPAFDSSNVKYANPRSVLGYYEPGRYCFVQVDGGQASALWFGGEVLSTPCGGGLRIGDVVLIREPG